MTEQTKARWKAIGWTVAFFACGIVGTILSAIVAGQLGADTTALWFNIGTLLFGFGLSTLIVGRALMGLSWQDLRYRGVGAPWKGVGVGLGVGVVPAVLAMAIAVPAGHAAWSLDGGTRAQWSASVLSFALLLVPAAFAEEVVFRGVGYVTLSKAFGRVGPALALSLLFGAAHLRNPNVTGLAIANVAIAGIFLSAAFWLPGGIWAATGVHLGWNITLAALGAPVSGIDFTLPMLDYAVGGPGWLTGGTFGPEGGVIATVIVGTAAVVLLKRTKQA